MGAISAAMGLVSLFGASKGAKAAKKAGKAEAALGQRQTAEKIHMLKQEERTLAGDTRNIAAGSNVKADTGSPLTALAEQAKRFARERKFVSEVGAEKSDIARQHGRNVAEQTMYSGVQSALGAFGQSASSTKKHGFFGFG